VLAVGLVPYRDESDSEEFFGLDEGLELVHAFVGETVTHSE
jgi:hypothetical protein